MPARLFELIMNSTGGMTTSGMVLRIALVICSFFAVVHLFSLWGTRYGDNNTLAKSFVLSLVLHGCFGLGWATVAESYPQNITGEEPGLDKTSVNFVDNVDSSPEAGTNKLPIFYSGAAAAGVAVTRDARATERLDTNVPETPIESPQIEKTPEAAVVEAPLPNLPVQADEQAPELETSPEIAPKSVASTPLNVDQPDQQVSPEVSARIAASRSRSNRQDDSIESPALSNGKQGASTQVTPDIEEGRVLPYEAEISADALPKPQGAVNEETVRRQGSPTPSAVIDSNAGTGAENAIDTRAKVASRRIDRRQRPSNSPEDGLDDISTKPSVAKVVGSKGNLSTNSREISTPRSFEPLDESHQPSLERPQSPTMSRAPARAPETYQARSSGQRMSSVLRNGGSEQSEQAVERSLKWLSSVQEDDGRWSSSRHGGGSVDKDPHNQPREGGGKFADSGVTGLVILSFLGAGYNHEKGPYTSEVRKALDWLIQQQEPNGFLGGKAANYDRNYCHAIATFALAEAYAMQQDGNDYPELGRAVRRGVGLISYLQNDDGGWRYNPKGDKFTSDMSMFGWQLMALKSAVNGGIAVPEDTRRGMVKFLDNQGRGEHKGLAGYRGNDPWTPAMTAEALFCRQMFSVRSNDAASREAVDYLLKNLPRATAYDEYYWYYGTLAMRQVGGQPWEEWNDALRDMLISMQRRQGVNAGSWNPDGKWAKIGGRLYSTALSTMCLEVYYRYQSNAKLPVGK